jgi:ABC-type Fe3+/spermidine/putrescine transport system ATPase subunit
MNAGQIEQLGRPREIYDAPATQFVADFIGETNFIRLNGRTVAVRPERMAVARAPRDGAAYEGVRGEVVTAMVVGPLLQWVVQTETGDELLVRQQRTGNGDTESLGQGDRVVVTWAPEAALELKGREEE